MAESHAHRTQVNRLVSAGAKAHGFTKAVLDAIAGPHGSHKLIRDGEIEYTECDRCLLREEMPEGNLIPDAYRIDADRMEVLIYEVEVTHPVPEWKLERYIELWWVLDEDYWMARLFIVNRFGNENEVDLFATGVGIRIGNEPTQERLDEVRAFMGIRKPGEPANNNKVP